MGEDIQCTADYHNIIYYKDADGLYVNQYVPSEVTWGDVKLRQETAYPEGDKVTITLNMPAAKKFRLNLRVPAWAGGMDVNTAIPLNMRMQAVDGRHPNRVAIVRGPVVLVQDANYHDPVMKLPMHDEDLPKWILPGEAARISAYKLPKAKCLASSCIRSIPLARIFHTPLTSIGTRCPMRSGRWGTEPPGYGLVP